MDTCYHKAYRESNKTLLYNLTILKKIGLPNMLKF